MEALGLDVLFMGSNATRLLQGLWVAVQISAISVVLSIILGMLFGIFMTWKNPVAKVISRLYLEIVRICRNWCCSTSCSSAPRVLWA